MSLPIELNRTRPSSGPKIRRPVQLSVEVTDYVRELILTGQVRSGELLNIEALARELGVSTTPVREALLSLRGEGFVILNPRRGFRIARLTPEDVSDLYWLQSQIAGELAARAARERSRLELDALIELQTRMRAALKRGAADEVEGMNFEFHRIINHPDRSRKLAWMLSQVVRYAPRRFYQMIGGWVEASLQDHEAVLEAFERQDPAAARRAMQSHILHAGELLVANMKRQGFWASSGADEGSQGGMSGQAPAPQVRDREKESEGN